MSARVRPAGPADRPALIRFMAALQDHERALGHPNREDGAAMAAEHLEHLLAEAAADPGGGSAIAEIGGTPVGFCLWIAEIAQGRCVAPENRRFGTITDAWVEPGHRGLGVGTALIRAAEAHLAAHGITHVEISAIAQNPGAAALYRRLGYADDCVTLSRSIPKG